MLKILQTRLQQYVNCELPDVQASFREGRGTREQIANIRNRKSKRVPEKHLFQNFPQFIVIHTVKGFGIVNKEEIDVFLELS